MTASTRAETILGFNVRTSRWNASIDLTPEQAKMILEAQPKQRPVSQSHVNALVEEIKAGRFVQTNEAIAFDQGGLLFDGQHRLWACFESGMSIEALCCFNEPRENFDRIGTVVRKRTNSDHLMIDGLVSDSSMGNLVGAAGRFIWAYDLGANPTMYSFVKGWSHDALRATLSSHPLLVPTATQLTSGKLLFPRAVTVALLTLMTEAEPQKAAIFAHQIITGEGLQVGDPALTLRASATAASFLRRAPRTEMAYRMVRAWNAFYAGRSLTKVFGSNSATGVHQRMRRDGLDPFPQIAGLHQSKPASNKQAAPTRVRGSRGKQLPLTQQVSA